MRLWRIAKSKFIKDLAGTGAKAFGSRWNSKGVAVLYCTGSQSLCALEQLVHFDPEDAPSPFSAIALEVPDPVFDKRTRWLASDLPATWQDLPAPATLQKLGDDWVKRAASLVLEVPSAVIPREASYVLNPSHPDMAKVTASEPEPFVFDPRLWKTGPAKR